MYNLKVLDVTGCEQLTVTPDLSGFLALERLILEDCKKLTRIHSSIGELKHLEHLNVKGCDSLQELPEELGSLLSLVQILAGGSSLHKLRTSLGNLTALSILEVTKGTISKLPRTIGGMWGLKRLSLHGCQRLKKLPDSLGHLKYLIELDLSDTGITRLPYSVGKLTKLENIKIESSLITELPPSIGNLKKLEELNARRCRGLRRIPYEIGELSSLRLLQLSHTSIEELPCLPESLSSLHVKSSSLYVPDLSRQNDLSDLVLFGESGPVDWVDKLMKLVNLKLGLPNLKCLPSGFASLSLLKSLYLTCDNLLSIPPLPPNISRLILTGLREDTVLPNLSNLKNLSLLELRECKLCELTGLKLPRQLKAVNIIKFDFLERLPDLSILKDLSFLEFHSLGKLNELKLPGRLKGLYVADCMCLEILPDLSHLKHLELLHLSNCGRLSDVPGLGELTSLRKLTIHHCDNLRSLGDLSKLRNLAYLELHDCQNLKDVQGLGSLSLKRVSIYSCHSLINLPQTTLRTSRVKASMEYSICRDELKLSTKRKLPSQVKQKVKKRCP